MPEALKSGGKTLPRKKEKTREPKDYSVILLNDDYTTREFVVMILETIFHLEEKEAVRIMLLVHHKGRGAVGRYTWDIAQTKSNQVHVLAKEHDFPLRCVVEEA